MGTCSFATISITVPHGSKLSARRAIYNTLKDLVWSDEVTVKPRENYQPVLWGGRPTKGKMRTEIFSLTLYLDGSNVTTVLNEIRSRINSYWTVQYPVYVDIDAYIRL